MLSYRTIAPHTLELLKHLMAAPVLQDCPKMWMNVEWESVKESISEVVRKMDWNQFDET